MGNILPPLAHVNQKWCSWHNKCHCSLGLQIVTNDRILTVLTRTIRCSDTELDKQSMHASWHTTQYFIKCIVLHITYSAVFAGI